MPGVIPSEDAFERFSKATKHYEQTYNNRVLKGTKKRVPGRGRPCKPRNERWGIYLSGPPTSGNLTLITTVNGVTENVTFAYNAANSAIQTAFEGHSEIGAGNVEVTGGTLPTTSIQVEMIEDLARKLVPVPFANISALGGSAVGCTVVRLERGLPGDAS
jgi:hypothetical protein